MPRRLSEPLEPGYDAAVTRPRVDPAPAGLPDSEQGPAGARFSVRGLLVSLLPLVLLGALIALEVPFCPTRGLLGIPCPGCGLTRATESMVVGDLAAMLRYHPLAPIISPLVLVAVLRMVLVSAGLMRRSVDPLAKLPKWVWGGFAALMFGVWLLRLFGLLGGTPDPVDPSQGVVYRGVEALWTVLSSLAG